MPRLVKNSVVPALLLVFSGFYFFATYFEVENYFQVDVWPIYILVIPFIFGLILWTKWALKKPTRKLIAGLVFVFLLFSREISNLIFLGKEVGRVSKGMDAGSMSIHLYDRGRCKLVASGIIGEGRRYYGKYRLEASTVFVELNRDLHYLEGESVRVANRTYFLKAEN